MGLAEYNPVRMKIQFANILNLWFSQIYNIGGDCQRFNYIFKLRRFLEPKKVKSLNNKGYRPFSKNFLREVFKLPL